MPELPEVETVRLQLLHKIKGKTITGVVVHHNKSAGHDTAIAKKLHQKVIKHIDRIGKLMILSFKDEGNLFLLAHLKMTGQFFYVDKRGSIIGGGHSMIESDRAQLPNKHTRITFYFSDTTALHFNDMRLFGYVKVANKAEVDRARSAFGQEPISPTFDVADFTKKLQRRNTPIKAALLDQSFVAGLGNIYVDETLWHAKVAPTRSASKVTSVEAKRIAHYAGETMNTAISVGGTTFQHFVDTDGENGNYTDYLRVFGKQGTPCPRCKTPIVKIRCAGRGTHYCPKCQK